MVGRYCAVALCYNSYGKSQKESLGLTFHTFPKDPKMRKLWIDKCKRLDKFNPNTSYICSEHFHVTDFIRDLQNEMLGLPMKRKLKKYVLPQLKIPHESLDVKSLSPTRKKANRKKQACIDLGSFEEKPAPASEDSKSKINDEGYKPLCVEEKEIVTDIKTESENEEEKPIENLMDTEIEEMPHQANDWRGEAEKNANAKKDSLDLFFKFMCAATRALPVKHQQNIKNKVFQIILQEEEAAGVDASSGIPNDILKTEYFIS